MEAGRKLLLRLQQPDMARKLHRNLKFLQAADRDDVANDMLIRLFNGLISGKFEKANSREDLFKLIGGINFKCRQEFRKKNKPRQKTGMRLTLLPENCEIPADATGPDELVEMEDSIRNYVRQVKCHVDEHPEDFFMIEMVKMLFEGYTKKQIIENIGISEHKYRSRYQILLMIVKGQIHGSN